MHIRGGTRPPSWGKGPWDDEADFWCGVFSGLLVYARRHSVMGHWCGYVVLPPGHPRHGLISEDDPSIKVHGGVTAAAPGHEGNFLVGFDCAHMRDHWPQAKGFGQPTVYRDLPYVRKELQKLALQVQADPGRRSGGAHHLEESMSENHLTDKDFGVRLDALQQEVKALYGSATAQPAKEKHHRKRVAHHLMNIEDRIVRIRQKLGEETAEQPTEKPVSDGQPPV